MLVAIVVLSSDIKYRVIMKLILVLFCLVNVVFCVPQGDDDHPHCCWKRPGKHKFRMVGGKVDPETGEPVSVESRGYGYSKYDGRKRVIYRNVSYSGAPEIQEMEIVNYFTMKWYVVSNGTCKTYDILFPMPKPCVPANATYSGESVIGSTPGHQVTIHHYNLDWMDFKGYNIRVGVEASTCDMVMETDYGTVDRAKAVYTYFFSDRGPYEPDDAVFAVPSNCPQHEATTTAAPH